MQRRGFCVVMAMLIGATIAPVRQAAAQADGAYRGVADWLFELYAAQSVRLSIANALRQRPPGTEQVLGPRVDAMVQSLTRHRQAFVDAMERALRSQVDAAGIQRLLEQSKSSPPAFDEIARKHLFDVDAEFRRDAQTVIRAMTADIGLMIATTLSEQQQRSQ